MNRKAFTLVELIVVIAILGIVLALVIPAVIAVFSRGEEGQSFYDTQRIGVYECTKTYTMNVSESETSKRVDLKPVDGGMTETFVCDDDFRAGIRNSATLYAQFQEGNFYEVSSVGFRKEGYIARFPIVTNVREVDPPQAEVQQMENPVAPQSEVSEKDFLE